MIITVVTDFKKNNRFSAFSAFLWISIPLSKINTGGMSFGDFFVALFQGVAGAVTA